MVRPIMDHMAALAQAPEIAQPVVARIVIEMRRGQDHPGVPDLHGFHEIGPSGGPAAAIAPGVLSGVEPPPVGQATDGDTMGPAASLAHAGSALEPHPATNLQPIVGIKPPHLTEGQRGEKRGGATGGAQVPGVQHLK